MTNKTPQTAVDNVLHCRDQYEKWEPEIGAWKTVDIKGALKQAHALENSIEPNKGNGNKPLKGVVFGVKDVIDTAGMLTQYGSSYFSCNIPSRDAVCVAKLKESGGILFGKTVTTEFATRMPGSTRNPLDTSRTPGGSSSGSAAAVASGVVPLAIGTQTVGSVIRPAAYCGVPAIKPTKGAVSNTGVHALSPFFDDLGFFGQDFTQLANAMSALLGTEAGFNGANGGTIRIGVAKTPYWNLIEPAAQESFDRFCKKIENAFGTTKNTECNWVEGDDLEEKMWTLISYELNNEVAPHYGAMNDSVSSRFLELLNKGRSVSRSQAKELYNEFIKKEHVGEALFDGVDVILSPAALGAAPKGIGDTGSPCLNAVWQVTGLPVVHVPAGRLQNGMPVGVQVVGPRHEEEMLIRVSERIYEASVAK